MQTLYCFLYSLISIQWRSYIMFTGKPVLLQLDVVRKYKISIEDRYSKKLIISRRC